MQKGGICKEFESDICGIAEMPWYQKRKGPECHDRDELTVTPATLGEYGRLARQAGFALGHSIDFVQLFACSFSL